MTAHSKIRLTVPEFLAWWDSQATDEQFELVDGEVVAMVRDRVAHNEAKFQAVVALRQAIGRAGVDCRAFVDGLGVATGERSYRLPDAVVNRGPVEPDATVLPNPVVVVEVVSPRSEARDVHEKIADYFSVPSIMHYLIVYPENGYVVHHGRLSADATIETRFVRDGTLDLTPPGLQVDVAEFLDGSAR